MTWSKDPCLNWFFCKFVSARLCCLCAGKDGVAVLVLALMRGLGTSPTKMARFRHHFFRLPSLSISFKLLEPGYGRQGCFSFVESVPGVEDCENYEVCCYTPRVGWSKGPVKKFKFIQTFNFFYIPSTKATKSDRSDCWNQFSSRPWIEGPPSSCRYCEDSAGWARAPGSLARFFFFYIYNSILLIFNTLVLVSLLLTHTVALFVQQLGW